MLVDEQTSTLSYRVYHGLSRKFAEEMHLDIGEGLSGRVARSGKPIMMEDISQESEVAKAELITMEGLKAYLCVPLKAKDYVFGVMNIVSKMPRHFTKRDMHLLHSIGDMLGVAIEQAKLQKELREGMDRYQQLSRQMLTAQEEERRKIARELHDETSQTLSGLAINLQTLIEMAAKAGITNEEFMERLKMTQSLAIQINTEVARLMGDLRPALLDTLGLVPAIRQYAQTNLKLVGIDVVFNFDDIGEAMLPETEVGLFRWSQGAISNIRQHSGANNVEVSLKRDGGSFILRITDDGVGFDISQIKSIEEGGRGAGLFSMNERMLLLGGTCIVESRPGYGTTAIAKVPIT
ncbi:GAF domain-containing protein [Chloroflexota bacterium]